MGPAGSWSYREAELKAECLLGGIRPVVWTPVGRGWWIRIFLVAWAEGTQKISFLIPALQYFLLRDIDGPGTPASKGTCWQRHTFGGTEGYHLRFTITEPYPEFRVQ